MSTAAPSMPPPIPGRLSFAVALIGLSGYVDALAFDRTGTFVANMTGNTVLLGLGIGQWAADQALPPLVAIAAFLAGSVVAAAARRARPRNRAARRLLLAGEAALLGVAALIALVSRSGAPLHAASYAIIAVGSAAMALQTATVRTVRGNAMSTTFDTGMLASLGSALTLRSWRAAQVVGSLVVAYVAGAALGGVAAAADPRLLALAAPVAIALLVATLRR